MTYRKLYWLSLGTIIIVSVYPIYMGVCTLVANFQQGYVDATNYQKYIIPYAPICIALIVCTLLLPVVSRVFKKHTLLAITVLGTVLFFATEVGFEQIKVLSVDAQLPLESWQYSLCMATPEVLQSIGEATYAQNNPAYKIHFYIIALVIIWTVINVVYGFLKMYQDRNFEKKQPLMVQLICVVLFVALCILACFTAFYRNGTLNISPLSAGLMSVFFMVFGVTFGVYFGCVFYGKKKSLSIVIPTFIAATTTVAMYIGELILMGGVLFKFGSGFIFEPLGMTPFAVVDIIVILSSAIITYVIEMKLNKKSVSH